jgi:glyoxylase-like metal-dependent hydrolase (beta-lactamase superfamily II)
MTSAISSDVIVEPLLIGSVQEAKAGRLVLATVTSIRTATRHVLVDTGGFNQWDALRERLQSLPPVTDLVLTHFHWDHCANVRQFARVSIYANPMVGTLDRATLVDVLGVPMVAVQEGDCVAGVAEIFLVPGHTANHLAVRVATSAGRVTVAGDAVAHIEDARQGCPRLVFHSEELARASLRRILEVSDWVIPGHGNPFAVADVVS